MPKDILFSHGDPYEAPVECHATLNQLTLTEKTKSGEPRVQDYLWSGTKLNDRNVPMSNKTLHNVSFKRSQWQVEEQLFIPATTYKVIWILSG